MFLGLLGDALVVGEAWATVGWVVAALTLADAALVWVGRALPRG